VRKGEPDSSKRLHPQRRGVSLGSPLPPGVPGSLKLTLSNSNRPNGSPLPQIRPYQTVSACNTNHWRGSRRLPVVALGRMRSRWLSSDRSSWGVEGELHPGMGRRHCRSSARGNGTKTPSWLPLASEGTFRGWGSSKICGPSSTALVSYGRAGAANFAALHDMGEWVVVAHWPRRSGLR
jgi:hypothetical protein